VEIGCVRCATVAELKNSLRNPTQWILTIKLAAPSSAMDLQGNATLCNPAQWIFRLKIGCATQRNGCAG
jgi:hypothetical protein